MGCTRVMLSSLKIRIILLKRLLKLSYPYFRTTKYLHNIIIAVRASKGLNTKDMCMCVCLRIP